MIEFSLLGETILEWDANDLENYHSQRMVMDSILCGFKNNNKYATSKHLGAIIANAGSMPSELSGFGC